MKIKKEIEVEIIVDDKMSKYCNWSNGDSCMFSTEITDEPDDDRNRICDLFGFYLKRDPDNGKKIFRCFDCIESFGPHNDEELEKMRNTVGEGGRMKHCSKDNLRLISGMISELRRIREFARIDVEGKADLSDIEQKLIKFHKKRSK